MCARFEVILPENIMSGIHFHLQRRRWKFYTRIYYQKINGRFLESLILHTEKYVFALCALPFATAVCMHQENATNNTVTTQLKD